jgi:thiol-disulfide isomerase/thioredoxin
MSVFSSEAFEVAAARAEREGKWLLIDFTASWCGPCQNMEKTTWRDAAVSEWLSAKAVAVQVDVDAQQELAQSFGVQAMPTMVVFARGQELDRAVGAQSAKQLLGWLEGLEQGKTLLDAQREAAKDGGPSERFRLARELMVRGEYPDAAKHALWCWEHSLEADRAFVGVRHSYLVALLKDLVFLVPSLQDRLVELRETAEHTNPDDFLSLNVVLGSPERTLAWFERVRNKERGLERHRELVELLVERNRWADLGELFQDPIQELESAIELRSWGVEGVPPEHRAALEAEMARGLRRTAMVLFRSMLAADRSLDAEQVAKRAIEADSSDEMRRIVALS